MDLTTLANVARLLDQDLESLDETTEAQLAAKITEVSGRVAAFCNRQFERVERVYLHNGGGQYLVLPEIPVQSIKQVLYSYSWDWDAATVYGDSDYALINPAAGIVGFKWAGAWPQGDKALQVTYTGGYDPAPVDDEEPDEDYVAIPADLEGAVCRQVVYEWRRRNDPGISSVSLPDGTINKMQVDEWMKDVVATLKRYRVRPG
jgi:hypothetical protein